MSLRRAGTWVLLGSLGASLGVAGCKKPPPPLPPPTVLVTPAVQQDLSISTEMVGTIDGYVNAEIRARVKGFLKTQDYADGAFVKKGQLLFTIDPAEYDAAVAKAEGRAGPARRPRYAQAKVTGGSVSAARREAGGEPAGPRHRRCGAAGGRGLGGLGEGRAGRGRS